MIFNKKFVSDHILGLSITLITGISISSLILFSTVSYFDDIKKMLSFDKRRIKDKGEFVK